nr:ion transporter [Marinibactrum halimedae]
MRERLFTIIFGTDTSSGKRFDLVLIAVILASVCAVIMDSVEPFATDYKRYLLWAEWAFTIFFTLEYGLRVYCAPNRWRYVRSFYGVVDVLAILPTYLGLFLGNINYLLIIRLLRVLRIFRVLKLVQYLQEANTLIRAMVASRRKILVFFATVSVIATVFGSLMFVVEGPENGFTSIPKSIYWTIVTITTVGYGDITPQSPAGQVIAALAMLTGYSIIAVPTGILTAELSQEMQRERHSRSCPNCSRSDHDRDAIYCKHCGCDLDKKVV